MKWQLIERLENNPHLVALTVAGAIAIGSALASYDEWRRYSAIDHTVEQSRMFAEKTEDLLSLLKDAETGQRGYLLTGDPRYLQPYREGIPSIQVRLSELGELGTSSGNAQQAQVLSQLVGNRLAELKQTVELRRNGSADEALQLIKTGRGKASMDEIRRVGRAISQATYTRNRKLSDQARSSAGQIRLFLLLGSALITALLAISTIRVHRLIRARDRLISDLNDSRRVAEHAREVFETTLRSIGDAVIATDERGTVRFLNTVAEQLTGWPADDAIGRPLDTVFRIVSEATREPVESPATKVIREGKIVGLANHTVLLNRDGTEIPIDDSGAPIHDGSQTLTGVVLVFRNVAEQRQAHQRLADSEQRHRLMFESNPQPMWVYELDTLRFLAVNDAAIHHYGYTREEFLGMTLRDIRSGEDVPKLLKHLQCLSSIVHTDGPWIHRKRDGSQIYAQITAHPIDFDKQKARLVVINDITEQIKAEEALRRSEEEYRAIVETASDAIVQIDEQSNIVFASKHAETIFGWEPEELVGRRLTALMPERLRKSYLDRFQRYLAAHQRKQVWSGIEFSALHRDGFEIPVELSLGKSNLNGRQFVTGIIRDVSQAKKIQERLRTEKELLKAVINTVPVAVWEIDLDGKVTFWNKTATLLFGWNADEVVGKPLPVVPADRQQEYAELLEQYRAGHSLTGFETVRRHRDGSPVPVSAWTAPLSDKHGNITGTLGVLVDLTQRKRDERALADSEAGFRLLFENNPQPMCVFHAENFGFLEVNRAAVAKYGYTRDEFLSMRATDLRHPDDISRFVEFHSEYRTGIQHVGIWRHLSKSGARIDVDVISHRLEYHGVPAVLAVLDDVTEQKRLEDQLRQAQKLEAIGQLAGGVAHDFNNLLTAILGYGELLRQSKPQNAEAVDEIIKAAERAASLTHQLLAFSRRQVLQPQPLNLNSNVLKIRNMLSRLLGEDINLITLLAPDLSNISADSGQIDQIIVNLTVNSRDAMERGGSITIQTSNVSFDDGYAASHVGVEAGDYVLLSISDTGTGMTEETRSRIFEPFFTTKEAGRGTGLGLATVYGIVKQSGGNIWVYSELGKGTTFKVYFPRLASAESSLNSVDRQDMQETQSGHESILIVEDDPSVRKLVSNMLANSGYRTMTASNAEEALNICQDSSIHIDLLISDLVLPGIDGRELGHRVLEFRSGLKVLFMSGYTEHAVLRQNVFAPGTFFIQKPFARASLANKVREVLDETTS